MTHNGGENHNNYLQRDDDNERREIEPSEIGTHKPTHQIVSRIGYAVEKLYDRIVRVGIDKADKRGNDNNPNINVDKRNDDSTYTQ